jgi:hypothetical protein
MSPTDQVRCSAGMQILTFPIFGLHTTLAQNLRMGAVFR